MADEQSYRHKNIELRTEERIAIILFLRKSIEISIVTATRRYPPITAYNRNCGCARQQSTYNNCRLYDGHLSWFFVHSAFISVFYVHSFILRIHIFPKQKTAIAMELTDCVHAWDRLRANEQGSPILRQYRPQQTHGMAYITNGIG